MLNTKSWVMKIGVRLAAALTSSFAFSMFFALISYTPESQRRPDTYYFEVWETFFLGIIYVTPIYFLIGIPISLVVDHLLKHKTKIYLIRVGLYSISSLLPSLILLILFSSGSGSHSLTGFLLNWLISLFAANLFLHILIVLEIFIQKTKNAIQKH